MSNQPVTIPVSQLEDLHTTGAGYDILRYLALPDLLGEQAPTLLYFMGKNLARKFDIQSIQDVIYIFEKLGIGHLELVKEKKRKKTFHLMADSVVLRLKGPLDADFRLESGFLAEAIEMIDGQECECTEEINRRIHQVEFSVFYSH
jgi:predicted hydrocarbon binding protein